MEIYFYCEKKRTAHTKLFFQTSHNLVTDNGAFGNRAHWPLDSQENEMDFKCIKSRKTDICFSFSVSMASLFT